MNISLASARRRLAMLLLAVAAFVGVGLALPGAANATIAPTTSFYAECSPTSVSTYSPDMRYYSNYGVSWNVTLYVWTSTGWTYYGSSRTQTAYGQNLLPDFQVWQQQQWATWFQLPRGRYYQARVNARWFGASSATYTNVTVHHQIAQGNFNSSSIANSSSNYCYIP